MKRRAEFLVEKRDGRQEWLRASKLARSILQAMQCANPGEDQLWRAMELGNTVLLGLRCRRLATVGGDDEQVLKSEELAAATQRVLSATGYRTAAQLYHEVGVRQRQRRSALQELRSETPAPKGWRGLSAGRSFSADDNSER